MATTLFFPVYFWWASGNCSHNFLFLIDRSGTCSCNQSHSKYKGLCFQRCTSSYLGCNEWVFELLLPSCHFISSQNSLAVLVWPLALIRLFFFFCQESCCSLGIFSFSDQPLYTVEMVLQENSSTSAVSEIFTTLSHQQPCHIHSLESASFPILMLSLSFSRSSWPRLCV